MRERRKLETVEMAIENMMLFLEREKSSAVNMHSAVCENVDFVAQIYLGDDGTVVQNIRKRYGSVLSRQKMESVFVLIVKVFQRKLLNKHLLSPIGCCVMTTRMFWKNF